MKKSFKLFLAAAFLATEFFVIALPMLTTSARADGAIQAITHAGFGGGTDVTTRMMLLSQIEEHHDTYQQYNRDFYFYKQL